MSGGDHRFMSVPHAAIRELTLEQVKAAVMSQLTTDTMELSLAGDFDRSDAEQMILKYIGTVPASSRAPHAVADVESIPQIQGSRRYSNSLLQLLAVAERMRIVYYCTV
jgi:predicted Zn-dependent peptidase